MPPRVPRKSARFAQPTESRVSNSVQLRSDSRARSRRTSLQGSRWWGTAGSRLWGIRQRDLATFRLKKSGPAVCSRCRHTDSITCIARNVAAVSTQKVPPPWPLQRLERAGVPVEYRTARTKPEIALSEIDRMMSASVRFGCVLADAGYGLSAPFRQGLTARRL